jgi:hypothetical protein
MNAQGEAAQGLWKIQNDVLFDLLVPINLVKGNLVQSHKDDRLRLLGMAPGVTGSQGAGINLPLGFSQVTVGGDQYLTINCFLCHAGVVGKQTVGGLYNKDINFAALAQAMDSGKDLSALVKIFRLNNRQAKALNHFQSYNNKINKFSKYFKTVGDNLGPYISWMYIAYLKQDAKDFDDTWLPNDSKPREDWRIDDWKLPPVQAMAWWTMKYRDHHYWFGDSTNDIDQAALDFTINFSIPHGPDTRNVSFEKRFNNMKAVFKYAYSTISPRYPGKIDEALAEQGRALFHGEAPTENGAVLPCTQCHGTYTRPQGATDWSEWQIDYPRGINRHIVGTDLEYQHFLQTMGPLAQRLSEIGSKQGGGKVPQYKIPDANNLGYVAPPLDGVWATAPYFHDGSVPTLWDVLKSDDRMVIWQSNSDPRAYDFEKVGLMARRITTKEYEKIETASNGGNELEAPKQALRRTYMGLEFAKSIAGHTFGDVMNDGERKAVIEFLKTVSGPKVRPARPLNP